VDRYFALWDDDFSLLRDEMPEGMKAVGGVGNGMFEVVQDFAGYESLAYLRVDDPELYAGLFAKTGELIFRIWSRFMAEHGDTFAVCRIGDDLGFKSSTLLTPQDIRDHVIPQYRRIVELIHSFGKPFLLHSCGNIFAVMDDFIDKVKIDAKHSNEDEIAPFSVWVERYGDRIGNFGGLDMDLLCRLSAPEIEACTVKIIEESDGHGGFAFGEGNSVPHYVPAEGYLAMINAARRWRGDF
jgi:uroporphyrinogen decarboxylase